MQYIVIYRLRSRYRRVLAELRRELARIRPDADRLGDLRKRKLVLRDQLARLEAAVPAGA